MRRLLVLVFVGVITIAGPASASAPISGAAGNVEYWFPLDGRPRSPVLFLVTHDSWGPFGSGRATARNQSGGRVGVEWWVLADGTILHSDRERVTGHCGDYPAPGIGNGCNTLSVGIEFEGYLEHTQAQVRSGLALIRFLQERYCIGNAHIYAHRKAGNGAEGVAMQDAARNMSHNPGCTGALPTGGIPDSIVTGAARAPDYQGHQPSLQDLFAPSQPYTSSYYPPLTSPYSGSQNLLGAFGAGTSVLSRKSLYIIPVAARNGGAGQWQGRSSL